MDTVFSIAVWNDRRYWNFHVGQDGAKLQVRNVSLTVPPGALMKQRTLTVAISCNASDIPKLPDNQHLVGPVMHFHPHGLRFQQPVTLSFHGITVMQESSKDIGLVQVKVYIFYYFYQSSSCLNSFGSIIECFEWYIFSVYSILCTYNLLCLDNFEQAFVFLILKQMLGYGIVSQSKNTSIISWIY